jgi:hypothetical protein
LKLPTSYGDSESWKAAALWQQRQVERLFDSNKRCFQHCWQALIGAINGWYALCERILNHQKANPV